MSEVKVLTAGELANANTRAAAGELPFLSTAPMHLGAFNWVKRLLATIDQRDARIAELEAELTARSARPITIFTGDP